jgi:hypothetical protein
MLLEHNKQQIDSNYMSCVNPSLTASCPATPLSCLDPVNIFAGVYNPNCMTGFADPANLQAEQVIIGNMFIELINNFGVKINYFVNGFNLSAMNLIYGEHPLQQYHGPFIIKSYLQLEESLSLSRYGMDAADDLTAYIAIKDFSALELVSNVWAINGQRVEPKSDDLIAVTSLGCDRPGNRGAKIFRITEVLDQDVAGGINPFMGHYVWKITAKRYETSYETNAPMECGNDQVYDNTFAGKLSSTLFPTLTTQPKVYPGNNDQLSIDTVYNMDVNDTGIYGEYY